MGINKILNLFAIIIMKFYIFVVIGCFIIVLYFNYFYLFSVSLVMHNHKLKKQKKKKDI